MGPTDEIFAMLLGAAFGLIVALAIFIAELTVRRFARISLLGDVALRVLVFGVISIGTAELIGTYLGPFVRHHASYFWVSFFAGFFALPWVVAFHMRRSRNQSAG